MNLKKIDVKINKSFLFINAIFVAISIALIVQLKLIFAIRSNHDVAYIHVVFKALCPK